MKKRPGNWAFFFGLALQNGVFPYSLPHKKSKKTKGGGKNFCNFVAEYVKPILGLCFSRYKTRYKKIILSRIDYE